MVFTNEVRGPHKVLQIKSFNYREVINFTLHPILGSFCDRGEINNLSTEDFEETWFAEIVAGTTRSQE